MALMKLSAGQQWRQRHGTDLWTQRAGVGRVRCMQRVTWKLSDIMCKIGSQWEFAVGLRELKHGLCNNLEGWDGAGDGREFQEERDIRIPMADPCGCMAETNKTL